MTELNQNTPPSEKASVAVIPHKDKWDIIEILARPISAALTAFAIAAIGYLGNDAITKVNHKQQETRAMIAEREQDARLYTQLLSRREESESALRKDMFKQIMDGFFDEPKDIDLNNEQKNSDINNGISKKILRLEMLALNFGDSLSLGPLFSEMSKDIDRILKSSEGKIDNWKFHAAIHQKRIQGLARRVASEQLSTIVPKGEIITARIPFSRIVKPDSRKSEEWQYTWPYDYQAGEAEERPNSDLQKGDITRSITIQLRNANYAKKTVQVNLIIEDLDVDNPNKEPTEIDFTLDYFNFPLIDNTRLSDNERFAIVLEDFNRGEVVLKGVLFPGIYASQRDKPYLNEAIQDLKIQQVSIPKQDGTEDSNVEITQFDRQASGQ